MTDHAEQGHGNEHHLDNATKAKIEEFLTLEERVGKDVDKLQIVHQEAYTYAVRAHLTERDGDVDYNKLKDGTIREAFIESMIDVYVAATTDFWRRKGLTGSSINPPTDKLGRSLWIEQYMGMLGTQIGRIVEELKEKYTSTYHLAQMITGKNNVTERVTNKWLMNAINKSGLREEDKDSIITYMHANEFVDTSKLEFTDAISLLMRYRRGEPRSLSPEDIFEVKRDAYKKPTLHAVDDHGQPESRAA